MSKKINATISKIIKCNKKLHDLEQQLNEEVIDLIKQYCKANDVVCEIIVGSYIDINKCSIENKEGINDWCLVGYSDSLWMMEYYDKDFVNTLEIILDYIDFGTEILIDNFGEVVNSYEEIENKLRTRCNKTGTKTC